MKLPELEPRKRSILRAVVVEYVAAAEPVGSELIVRKHSLGVKSATVRSELAEMAEMGYLEQPHTSAGRIPSDLGYRYYVDYLLEKPTVPPEAKQEVASSVEEGEVLLTLVHEATRALSRLTQLLAAATILRDGRVTVRNAVLSALGPDKALLVLVFNNGHVENRLLDCPPGITLTDIGVANEILNRHLPGKTVRSLVRSRAPIEPGPASQAALIDAIWAVLRSVARDILRGQILLDGEEYILAQPEARKDADFVDRALRALSDTAALYEDVQNPPEGCENVTIGHENRRDELHGLSIVRRSFFVGETEAGTLAVIGPRRMAYDRSIPLVEYAAKALSHVLGKYLGN